MTLTIKKFQDSPKRYKSNRLADVNFYEDAENPDRLAYIHYLIELLTHRD